MAQLDTSIAFSGYVPNFANALASGAQAAAMRNEMSRQNALAAAMQTHGAGLVNGDPQAMNALAVFDPAMVMGVQDTRQGMDARALQMDATRQGMDIQMREWALRLDAAEREQRLAEGQQMLSGMIAASTSPQAWDAWAASTGQTQLIGQHGQSQTYIANLLPPLEALEYVQSQNAQPDVPDSFRVLQLRAQEAQLVPGTQAYADFMRNGGQQPAPGTNINVNTGENSNAFVKAGDEAAAARFNSYIEGGARATELMGDLQMLGQLAGQINTGTGAQVVAALGPIAQALGVEVEGLGEMQAFQSIVDRLAPALRPPGSGASSDFDARQFLSSLPSLGRTPEGNAIINETFNAIMQHRQAAAEIAAESFRTGTPWQDAEAKIRALGNPFQAFNAYNQSVLQPEGAAGFVPEVATVPREEARPVVNSNDMDAYNALPPGTVFQDENGDLFRKP